MKRQIVLVPMVLTWSLLAACTADETVKNRQAADEVQTSASEKTAEADPAKTGTDQNQQPLSAKQLSASARYERFEKDLLRLFEYMRKTDPDRADLLERAYKRSREDQIAVQMRTLVTMLKQGEFGTAVERQDEIIAHLGALLELLQSEDWEFLNHLPQVFLA